jgi:chromosome segregation ATPase
MPDDSLSCKIGVMMGKLDSLIDRTDQNMAMVRVRIDNIDNALSGIKMTHTDIKVAVAEIKTEQANIKTEQARLSAEQDVLMKLSSENIGKEKHGVKVQNLLFSILGAVIATAAIYHKVLFGS